jgi:hypothetical protein
VHVSALVVWPQQVDWPYWHVNNPVHVVAEVGRDAGHPLELVVTAPPPAPVVVTVVPVTPLPVAPPAPVVVTVVPVTPLPVAPPAPVVAAVVVVTPLPVAPDAPVAVGVVLRWPGACAPPVPPCAPPRSADDEQPTPNSPTASTNR